jgi:hypothetical protein
MEFGCRPLAFGSWFLALGSWLLGKVLWGMSESPRFDGAVGAGFLGRDRGGPT